jgi:gamma-glutamyltranspeptidase / glutathione hydrolase
MRSFHFPGRSTVHARRAMVATSHPSASLAAIEILKQGGNAVDAAIATAAVLGVVEPAMTGIGGDCFAIISKPGQKLIALNASGKAPKAATAAWYAAKGVKQIETQSPHAVTVPGAIDGWARLLADHGTMSFAQVLAPAIDFADNGFAVTPRVAHDWAGCLGKIKMNKAAAEHLLKDGRTPRVGEMFVSKAAAKTLRAIARDGRDGFYAGEVAADMVDALEALGGLHTLADFAAQSSDYVDTIKVGYHGVELHELPPNNHGIVALILLKMLAKLGRLSDSPTAPERYHVMMEACRLAYAVRDRFVADPAMAKVPVDFMLADQTIETLVKRIDRKRVTPDLGPVPEPAGSDTVCFSIVDESGMVVSFINSVFASFGTGLAAPRSGVVFHNRGQGFVLDPKHPNCIAPGKRPLHTLVPAMAMLGDKPYASFGVMGAAFQPIGHVYMMTNLIDYGLDPQEAIDSPRMFFEGGDILFEASVPAPTVERMALMGHKMMARPDPWGGAQIVAFDRANGTLIGASDARKDGLALGY